jgi:hypothetical protein
MGIFPDRDKEIRIREGTADNTYEMFPVGTEVIVITRFQDFMAFRGNERGKVIRNSGKYLGIIVEFDKPLMVRRPDDRVTEMESFNFNPDDLKVAELDDKELVAVF